MKPKLFSKNSTDRKLPLPQEIIDQIPNVLEDKELTEINTKIRKFEQILKDKKHELSNTSIPAGFGRYTFKLDSEKDAQYLIENIDSIEQLEGKHPENRRSDLLRQIGAIELAIRKLTYKKQDRFGNAIREVCQHLPPEVEQVFKDVLLLAEKLSTAIQRALELDLILNKKSISENYREAELRVLPYFREFLFGYPGRPSVGFILENQFKLWAARDEIKERKI